MASRRGVGGYPRDRRHWRRALRAAQRGNALPVGQLLCRRLRAAWGRGGSVPAGRRSLPMSPHVSPCLPICLLSPGLPRSPHVCPCLPRCPPDIARFEAEVEVLAARLLRLVQPTRRSPGGGASKCLEETTCAGHVHDMSETCPRTESKFLEEMTDARRWLCCGWTEYLQGRWRRERQAACRGAGAPRYVGPLSEQTTSESSLSRRLSTEVSPRFAGQCARRGGWARAARAARAAARRRRRTMRSGGRRSRPDTSRGLEVVTHTGSRVRTRCGHGGVGSARSLRDGRTLPRRELPRHQPPLQPRAGPTYGEMWGDVGGCGGICLCSHAQARLPD